MKAALPPGVSQRKFAQALRQFASVVGDEWVFATDEDRRTYQDSYFPGSDEEAPAAAGVAPKSVEEVQGILRVAREYRIPLWPVSRGKNLGYGGSAPVMPGTVVLDLVRMNRILEVNEKYGYCVVEPGVGFNELFAYLQQNKIKLFMSAPAQTWGSVMGNALDRGVGYTPYGDHASKICGLEIVLPDGDIVRTGMGAVGNGSCWHLFRPGFGPSWESVFTQSNYGVVTKMGLWMQPEPESTLGLSMSMQNESDLAPLIDALRPLKLNGTLLANPNIGNPVRSIASMTTRDQVWQGQGPMPPDVLRSTMAKFKLGWWTFNIRLHGYPEINEANARIIEKEFAKFTAQQFERSVWHRGDPIERSGSAIPSLAPLTIVNWRGGRGGHLTFSPVCPPNGRDAQQQYSMVRRRYEEFGFDYSGGFTVGERYLNHISMVFYDRDDADMTRSARELFKALIKDVAPQGYGEYRTHTLFYDEVAAAYDYNNGALRRLNERVKDALDPQGILAPGRMGIWPKSLRGKRS